MASLWRHYDNDSYPCSRVINLAISVLLALISSWYFNIICWRERIEVFFHDWKALADDSATASISDKGWTGTKETTSWVAGFLTSIHSVAAESFQGTLNLPTFLEVGESGTIRGVWRVYFWVLSFPLVINEILKFFGRKNLTLAQSTDAKLTVT